jgi:hypothetical protein
MGLVTDCHDGDDKLGFGCARVLLVCINLLTRDLLLTRVVVGIPLHFV